MNDAVTFKMDNNKCTDNGTSWGYRFPSISSLHKLKMSRTDATIKKTDQKINDDEREITLTQTIRYKFNVKNVKRNGHVFDSSLDASDSAHLNNSADVVQNSAVNSLQSSMTSLSSLTSIASRFYGEDGYLSKTALDNDEFLKFKRLGSERLDRDGANQFAFTKRASNMYRSERVHGSKLHGGRIKPTTSEENLPNLLKVHMEVDQWLGALDLEQYDNEFSQFRGVEDLLDFTETEVRALGVKNSAHRARIMSSLLALKVKYEKRLERLKDNTQRHSVAVDKRIRVINMAQSTDDLDVTDAKPSKSLCDLIMEPIDPATADPVALKKALEWELSLDARDLCSHAWYHGAIPRPRAEEIVQQNGEFLVRDCTSQPGNYVLTCKHKGQYLHFVINKILIQPNTVYERVQYQFEDEAYDTVPDLITFYVGSGKPISIASGARIQFPRNRLYPLSFYATKYPSPFPNSRLVSPINPPSPGGTFRYTQCTNSNSNTLTKSSPRGGTHDYNRPRVKKTRSQSLAPCEVNLAPEKCNSADGVIQSPLMTRSAGAENVANNLRFSTNSLPRGSVKMYLPPKLSATLDRTKNRVISDPTLSPCSEKKQMASPLEDENEENIPKCKERHGGDEAKDPESGRTSSNSNEMVFAPLQRVASYHASGSDSGNGSGDSAQSSSTGDCGGMDVNHRICSGVIIKNPKYLHTSESSTTLKNFDTSSAEEEIMKADFTSMQLRTKFDLENFHTLLLPPVENPPLDSTSLQGFKVIFKETPPRILANHLTKIDLDVIYGENSCFAQRVNSTRCDFPFANGVELCSLAHGHSLRVDLIERTLCTRLLVAVSILTCTCEDDRTDMLNKWIEVAIDTKTALGNLFGFNGIMLGLCASEIQKLSSTWHLLRQKYTDSAFNFEAKLRPTLKNMNECTNPQAPNTTLPHLIPLIVLHELPLDALLTGEIASLSDFDKNPLYELCIAPWESKASDFGLSTLFAHLDASRKFSENVPMFKRNAEIILGNDISRMDDLTLDCFRTEFHLKFLWGSRGAVAEIWERYRKFELILTALANKYCATFDTVVKMSSSHGSLNGSQVITNV